MRLRIASTLVILALLSTAGVSQQQVFNPDDDGVSLPSLIEEVRANYTTAAFAAGIEGIVEMKGVVLSDGMVGDITVTKSLDAGLDQEAIAAWKRSTFTPGLKDGQPVAVRVDFQTKFTLKGD